MVKTKPNLILALDNCTLSEAKEIVKEVSSVGVNWFKVGLELYTQEGPEVVRQLKSQGYSVFLDLKMYDIPNTVAKAVRAASKTGADLLTIHASGGTDMFKAALAESGSHLSLLAVTVLTSFGGESFHEICEAWGATKKADPLSRSSVALELAKLAAASGLPGIVCSVADLNEGKFKELAWKNQNKNSFPLFVTPGIRGDGDSAQDQKSVATVDQAVKAGSTHLVVGRPITAPANGTRAEAARKFLDQIAKSHLTVRGA